MRRIGKLAFAVALLACTVPGSAFAAFPGGNGKIAFHRIVHGPGGSVDFKVFTINPDGTGEQSLTPPGASDTSPAWSADGREVVFTGFSIVHTMNADGSDRKALVFGDEAAWSPDGDQIVFSRPVAFGGPTHNYDIYTMNADGTGVASLIGDPPGDGPGDREPDWSPDGTRIVFTRNPPPLGSGLFTIDPSGQNRTRLTVSNDSSPDWHPRGTSIVYAEGGRISVTPTTTGGRLTDGPIDRSPVWSPDGTKIAFERGNSIFVMDADGENEQLLVMNGQNLDWQPLPNRPPDCSAVRATPQSLGAPNHRLKTVTISGATDPDGDAVDIEITGVTQDEPVTGPPDAVATNVPHRVRLRAERDPKGDGRVYRIAFEASDGRGGTCTGTATASVRKGSRAPVDSAPPSSDSFGP